MKKTQQKVKNKVKVGITLKYRIFHFQILLYFKIMSIFSYIYLNITFFHRIHFYKP